MAESKTPAAAAPRRAAAAGDALRALPARGRVGERGDGRVVSAPLGRQRLEVNLAHAPLHRAQLAGGRAATVAC